MAARKEIWTETFKAAGDLSTKQNLFMKISAADTVDTCSGVTDKPIGVLLNDPAAANREAVVMIQGKCPVLLGGTVTAGDTVGTDGTGKAVAYVQGTDTTKYGAGAARQDGVSGDIIEVELACLPHARLA